MPALLAAACSWAVALGSVAVEADAGLATRAREVRLEREPSAGGPPEREVRDAGELEATPRLALVRHGRLELSLSYAPRLTLPLDLSAGAPELSSPAAVRDHGEVLHRGELSADGAATPNLTLRLRGSASRGRIDLLRASIYASDVLPTTGRLAWRSAEASVGWAATPTRRTTTAGSLGAFEAGGGDEAARAVVPLRRGVRAEASLRHEASRRDALALTADATWSRFTPALPVAEAAVVRAGAGWSRDLLPTLSARAAAGPAWSWSDAGADSPRRDLQPFAALALSHAPPRPAVTSELQVQLAPYLSPLTGAVEQRLDAIATSTWRATRAWELAVRGAAGLTRSETSHGAFWTGERHAELTSLELRASWRFASRGTVSVGPSARSQRSHDAALPSFVEWGASIEATLGTAWPG